MHTSYLESYLEPYLREPRIEQAIEAMRPHSAFFDTFAVRGMSGMIVGSILAHRLGKRLAFCRKSDECHSGYTVEGPMEPVYVIVDDQICSGHTVKVIHRQIKDVLRGMPYGLYTFDSAPQVVSGIHDVRDFDPGCSPSFDSEIPTPLTTAETPATEAAVQAA